MAIKDRVKKAWNAFSSEEESVSRFTTNIGPSSGSTPHRAPVQQYNEKTIITSIYTRIAVDVAGILIRHIKLDENDRYAENVVSALNNCLTLQPNIDQAPRSFRQDICMTLFDSGVAAIVPVDTFSNPSNNAEFDILSLRVGTVVAWYPKHVRVSLYNQATGKREEVTLEKRFVAIVENPLYAVMNEPNSTLQRLIRKLRLLDAVDEQTGSGKLDLIIQLPYVIKSEARRQQAEDRRKDIEFQLKGSKYGIAYTDGTEKITQLNRPTENNLLKQVELLTAMLYGQLGITEDIMNGTASESVMLNYINRTVEPILDAVIEAMQRSFLGIIGTNKKERIQYFRNPFKLIPLGQIAEIADKFTRNEILASNEIRGFLGIAPSKDPKADQLVNSNMPQPAAIAAAPAAPTPPDFTEMDTIMNKVFDGLDADIDKAVGGL